MHSYVPRAGHLHFGDLRQVGAPPAVEKGHPTPMATRQWFPPSGFLRREVQQGHRARRLAQQGTTERHRILLRCGGELVDEALDDEVVMGDTHPAPKAGVEHRLLVAHVLDLDCRDVVEQLDGPVHRVDIDPVLEGGWQKARNDGRTDDPVGPDHRRAPWIKAGRDPVVVVRAIDVVLNVLLAGPHDLERRIHLLRDAHGLGHVVHLEPAPEAATEEMVVDHDLLQREPGDLGRRSLRAAQHLRAGPHLASILPHVDRAVHRLHRDVRQERRLVYRFDLRRRAGERAHGVAVFPRRHTRGLRRLREPLHDVGGTQLRIRPVVPADGERRQSLLGRPHVVGHNGDCIVELNDLPHAGDCLRLLLVDSTDFAAQDRARSHRCDQHPRQPHVDPVLRRSVHLARRVEPLGRRAEQREVLRVLERDLVGHRQRRRLGGQHAIGEGAAA